MLLQIVVAHRSGSPVQGDANIIAQVRNLYHYIKTIRRLYIMLATVCQ